MIKPTKKDIGRKIVWYPGEYGDGMVGWRGEVFFGTLCFVSGHGEVVIETESRLSPGKKTTYYAVRSACDWMD